MGISIERRGRATDVHVAGCELYLLPVETRVPLKFGSETLTTVTCARVRLRVMGRNGKTASGWGETPLSVEWTWPSELAHRARHARMIELCRRLAKAWSQFDAWGHPLEIGEMFQRSELARLAGEFNAECAPAEPLPHLAALVCCAPFDIALHDAYGMLHETPTYATYDSAHMTRNLGDFFSTEDGAGADFHGRYPGDFLTREPERSLLAWHLVGGLDPLDESDLTGNEPADGYPVLLGDWIDRDGLKCLKVKLRGSDGGWDYERLVRVGKIARAKGVRWLSADFNCTVREPAYVNEVLDRLSRDEPHISDRVLYVEQPFPYELERYQIDVRSVAKRKLLFMDESAHDWRLVKLGRSLGWNGVALKTCKTQTGAILAQCWARAHGMALMVQDLTNPMLAQIPHVLLAAQARTIMGVESNAMQFYPDASSPEARVHPGLYARRDGQLSLATLGGPGFGYRAAEIDRLLPAPEIALV